MNLLSIQSFAPLYSVANPIIYGILVKWFVETSGKYFFFVAADDTVIYTSYFVNNNEMVRKIDVVHSLE